MLEYKIDKHDKSYKKRTKEIETALYEMLEKDINKIKKRTKERFKLEEEPMIFHFDNRFGPVYFLSEGEDQPKQNNPAYINKEILQKIAMVMFNMTTYSKNTGLKDCVPTMRFRDKETNKWIFFNDFEILHNKGTKMPRGRVMDFHIGIISEDPKTKKEEIIEVSSYLQKRLQRYFLHH